MSDKGKALFAKALNSTPGGQIRLRKNSYEAVVAGNTKWTDAVWSATSGGQLHVRDALSGAELAAFKIRKGSEYEKPKSKRYVQYRMRKMYTTVLREAMTYEASGYAPNPFEQGGAIGQITHVAVAKFGSEDFAEVEALLLTIQALREGRHPAHYRR